MNYYEHFKIFLPNYKRQYFKAKLQNDIECILDIKNNILKNWNLTNEQKSDVIKMIGIVE
ncbi:MAG: hypothetical protein HFI86_05720 [Bacilli bacterium]|nr:hypothetical protein [Bacilli bacterium]